MGANSLQLRAAEAPSGVGLVSRTAVVFAFLLGALLPIQWRSDMLGKDVTLAAADLLVLPAALLLGRRCLHAGKLGWWVFGLWSINLIAWVCNLSLLDQETFLRESAKIVTCYLFAVVGYAIGTAPNTERALVKGVVYVSIPIAVIAIQSYFTRVPALFVPDGRVNGLLTDPNAYGCFLALLITLVMSLPIDLLALPLFIGAGVVTFSRTGFIGMGIALLLGATHARMRRYLPTLVLAVAMAAGVYVWSITRTTSVVGLRVGSYEDTLDTRMMLWSRALDMVAQHPLIGIGRGAWLSVADVLNIPHNTLLSVATDTGLVGLVLFVVPLLVWLGRGLRRRATRAWAIVLFINLVGGLAVSFDNYRPFWLATGVLVAQLEMWEGRQRAQAAEELAALQEAPVVARG